MSTSTVAGIPENTTQADPKAVQEASGSSSAPNTTESHGPAVSTNYNNVERTSAADSNDSSGPKGVKGLAAAVHGVGEKIRGKFNGGVDETFNDDQGVAKSTSIASAGHSEMTTGKFAASTQSREGMLPGGEHMQRHAQANTDLNRE